MTGSTFSGSAVVGSTSKNYCALSDIKTSFVLNTSATTYSTSTTSDDFLIAIITGVSRLIDQECSRYFYQSTADETRYFTAKEGNRLLVGDMVSVTTIYTDNMSGDRSYPYTWATTDYDLFPYSAATLSEPEPYRWIETAPRGLYVFPPHLGKGVKIVGKWGWPEVPASIAKSCLLWSARTFMRYAAPLGETSMTVLGQIKNRIPPPDPDILALLNNYSLNAV